MRGGWLDVERRRRESAQQVNRNGMPALCGGVIRCADAPAKKRVLTGNQKLGSAPCHFQPKEWK